MESLGAKEPDTMDINIQIVGMEYVDSYWMAYWEVGPA